MEANGNPEIAKQIAIAVAQNLFVGSGDIPPYCSAGGRCLSGVFNFIAAFAGRSGALFSGPNSAGVKIYARNRDNLTEEEARMLISQLGATGLNPDTVVDWDPMRGPTKWGNLNNSAAQKILNYMNDTVVSQGAYMNSVFYYNPENFFVMSFDQWNYWKALGVDMTILGSE